MKAATLPGGILHRLDFRWMFPIGTLPIPDHPAVAIAMMIGPPLWIAWLAVSAVAGGGAILWWQPLVPALAIGVLMSIPFVSWGMMTVRAPLAQAVLILGAMALLALDVVAERAAIGWAVLPTGFVVLYVVQRIGGLWLIARLRRDADAWTPVDPGDATVVVQGERFTAEQARHLIARGDIARIVSVPGTSPNGRPPARLTMAHWLSTPAIAALRTACGLIPPPGWSLPDDAGHVVVRPIDAVPADGLTVIAEPYRSRLKLVTGALQRTRIAGDGIDRQVVWGPAQIVGRIPMFTVFHWTAILGGQSAWHIGFLRDRAVMLGPEGNAYELRARAFVARPEDGGRCDDPQPLLDLIAAAAADAWAQIDAFWSMIAADPTSPADPDVMIRLRDNPSLIRPGDGARLAAWLTAAKDNRLPRNARNAAVLLERLPEPEFVASGAAIMAVLNSRILAGEWRIRPDMDLSDVPRDCPRFGRTAGFALLLHVPKLYDRLAALGTTEAAFVAKLRASFKGPAGLGN